MEPELDVPENDGISWPKWTRDPLKVLCADDDEDTRGMLEELLGGDGHRLEFVEDGDSANEKLKSEAYDLVILDVVMPGMNGYQVAEQVTAREDRPRVVLFTGNPSSAEALQFSASNADVTLRKGMDLRLFLSTVYGLFDATA